MALGKETFEEKAKRLAKETVSGSITPSNPEASLTISNEPVQSFEDKMKQQADAVSIQNENTQQPAQEPVSTGLNPSQVVEQTLMTPAAEPVVAPETEQLPVQDNEAKVVAPEDSPYQWGQEIPSTTSIVNPLDQVIQGAQVPTRFEEIKQESQRRYDSGNIDLSDKSDSHYNDLRTIMAEKNPMPEGYNDNLNKVISINDIKDPSDFTSNIGTKVKDVIKSFSTPEMASTMVEKYGQNPTPENYQQEVLSRIQDFKYNQYKDLGIVPELPADTDPSTVSLIKSDKFLNSSAKDKALLLADNFNKNIATGTLKEYLQKYDDYRVPSVELILAKKMASQNLEEIKYQQALLPAFNAVLELETKNTKENLDKIKSKYNLNDEQMSQVIKMRDDAEAKYGKAAFIVSNGAAMPVLNASEFLKQAADINTEVGDLEFEKEGSITANLLRGASNSGTTAVPFLGGLVDLSNNLNLKGVIEKQQAGEKLSPAEEMLFKTQGIANYYKSNSEISKSYELGRHTFPGLVAFAGELALTAPAEIGIKTGLVTAASEATEAANISKNIGVFNGFVNMATEYIPAVAEYDNLAVRGLANTISTMVQTPMARGSEILANTVAAVTPQNLYYFDNRSNELISNINTGKMPDVASALLTNYLTEVVQLGVMKLGDEGGIFDILKKGAGKEYNLLKEAMATEMNVTPEVAGSVFDLFIKPETRDYISRLMLDGLSQTEKIFDPKFFESKGVREFFENMHINSLPRATTEMFIANRIIPVINGQHDEVSSSVKGLLTGDNSLTDVVKAVGEETFDTILALSPIYLLGASSGIAKKMFHSFDVNDVKTLHDTTDKIYEISREDWLLNKEQIQSDILNKTTKENVRTSLLGLFNAREAFESGTVKYEGADTFEKWITAKNLDTKLAQNISGQIGLDNAGTDFTSLIDKVVDTSLKDDLRNTLHHKIEFDRLDEAKKSNYAGFNEYYQKEVLDNFNAVTSMLSGYLNNDGIISIKLAEKMVDNLNLPEKNKKFLQEKLEEAKEKYNKENPIIDGSKRTSISDVKEMTFGTTLEGQKDNGAHQITLTKNKETGNYEVSSNKGEHTDQDIIQSAKIDVSRTTLEGLSLIHSLFDNSNVSDNVKQAVHGQIAERYISEISKLDKISDVGLDVFANILDHLNEVAADEASMTPKSKQAFMEDFARIVKNSYKSDKSLANVKDLNRLLLTALNKSNITNLDFISDLQKSINKIKEEVKAEAKPVIPEKFTVDLGEDAETRIGKIIKTTSFQKLAKWGELSKQHVGVKSLAKQLDTLVKEDKISRQEKRAIQNIITSLPSEMLDFVKVNLGVYNNSHYNTATGEININTSGKPSSYQIISELGEEIIHAVHKGLANIFQINIKMTDAELAEIAGTDKANLISTVATEFNSRKYSIDEYNRIKTLHTSSRTPEEQAQLKGINEMLDYFAKGKNRFELTINNGNGRDMSSEDMIEGYKRYKLFIDAGYSEKQALYYSSDFTEFFARTLADHFLTNGNKNFSAELNTSFDNIKNWVVKNIATPVFNLVVKSTDNESPFDNYKNGKIHSEILSNVYSPEVIKQIQENIEQLRKPIPEESKNAVTFTVDADGNVKLGSLRRYEGREYDAIKEPTEKDKKANLSFEEEMKAAEIENEETEKAIQLYTFSSTNFDAFKEETKGMYNSLVKQFGNDTGNLLYSQTMQRMSDIINKIGFEADFNFNKITSYEEFAKNTSLLGAKRRETGLSDFKSGKNDFLFRKEKDISYNRLSNFVSTFFKSSEKSEILKNTLTDLSLDIQAKWIGLDKIINRKTELTKEELVKYVSENNTSIKENTSFVDGKFETSKDTLSLVNNETGKQTGEFKIKLNEDGSLKVSRFRSKDNSAFKALIRYAAENRINKLELSDKIKIDKSFLKSIDPNSKVVDGRVELSTDIQDYTNDTKVYELGAKRKASDEDGIDVNAMMKLLRGKRKGEIAVSDIHSMLNALDTKANQVDALSSMKKVVDTWKQYLLKNQLADVTALTIKEVKELVNSPIRKTVDEYIQDADFLEKIVRDSRFRTELLASKYNKKVALSRTSRLMSNDPEFYFNLRKLININTRSFSSWEAVKEYNSLLKLRPQEINISNFKEQVDGIYKKSLEFSNKEKIKNTDDTDTGLENTQELDKYLDNNEADILKDYANYVRQYHLAEYGIGTEAKNKDVNKFLSIDISDFNKEEVKEYLELLKYIDKHGDIGSAEIKGKSISHTNYMHKLKSLKDVNDFRAQETNTWIKIENAKSNRDFVRDWFHVLGNGSFRNVKDILNLLDGFKKDYSGALVKNLIEPLDINHAKMSSRYGELMKGMLPREFGLKSKEEGHVVGMTWLLTQKPEFAISPDILSFLEGSGHDVSSLKLGDSLPKGEAYDIVHKEAMSKLAKSIMLSFGETPEGFSETDVQKYLKETYNRNGDVEFRGVKILGNEISNPLADKEDLYFNKMREKVLKQTGHSSIEELTNDILSKQDNFLTDKKHSDYLKALRKSFVNLKEGKYTDGQSLKRISEVHTGERFVDIEDYAPILRYKEFKPEDADTDILEQKAGDSSQQDRLFYNVYSDLNVNNAFVKSRKESIMGLETDAYNMLKTRADQQLFYMLNEPHRKYLQQVLSNDFFSSPTGEDNLSMYSANKVIGGLKTYFNRGITKNKILLRQSELRHVQNVMNRFRTTMVGSAFKAPAQLSSVPSAMMVMEGSPAQRVANVAWAAAKQVDKLFTKEGDEIDEFIKNASPEVYHRGVTDYDIPGFNSQNSSIHADPYDVGVAKNVWANLTETDKVQRLQVVPMLFFDRIAARTSFLALYKNYCDNNGITFDTKLINKDAAKFATQGVRDTQHTDNPLYRPVVTNNIKVKGLPTDGTWGELGLQSVFAFKSFSMNEEKTLRVQLGRLLYSLPKVLDTDTKSNSDLKLSTELSNASQAVMYNLAAKMSYNWLKALGGSAAIIMASSMYKAGSGRGQDYDKNTLGDIPRSLDSYNIFTRSMLDYFGNNVAVNGAMVGAIQKAEEHTKGVDKLNNDDSYKYINAQLGSAFGFGNDVGTNLLQDLTRFQTSAKQGLLHNENQVDAAKIANDAALVFGFYPAFTSEFRQLLTPLRKDLIDNKGGIKVDTQVKPISKSQTQ